MPLLQDVVVNQPKAAGEESAFAARKAIDRAVRVVARDESVLHQMFFDSAQRCL